MKLTVERILIVVLLVALVFSVRSCSNNAAELRGAIDVIGRKDTIIERYRDEQGRMHHIIQEREFTLATLKASHDEEIAALRKDIGRLKDFVSRTVVVTQAADTVRVPVYVSDSGQVQTFAYDGEWIRIGGTVKGNVAQLDYTARNAITLDRKWQRPKWYKRKQLVLDVMLEDPRSTLVGITTYTVKPDPPHWYETRGAQAIAAFLAGYIVAQ